jgi:hypothetical protein
MRSCQAKFCKKCVWVSVDWKEEPERRGATWISSSRLKKTDLAIEYMVDVTIINPGGGLPTCTER